MLKTNQITDDIFTVESFFSDDECDQYITFAESLGFEEAPINTKYGPQRVEGIRSNHRAMTDNEELAALLWNRACSLIPASLDGWSPVSVNERIRFYRYETDEQFDWHYDGSFRRSSHEESKLTFMIYLDGDCDGGHTVFTDRQYVPKPDYSVAPIRGSALFFKHAILHKGMPVTSGKKYVLRTDVMYREDVSESPDGQQ